MRDPNGIYIKFTENVQFKIDKVTTNEENNYTNYNTYNHYNSRSNHNSHANNGEKLVYRPKVVTAPTVP